MAHPVCHPKPASATSKTAQPYQHRSRITNFLRPPLRLSLTKHQVPDPSAQMEQQPSQGADGANTVPIVHLNGSNPGLDQDLINNPEAMVAMMMPNQPFTTDPSVGAMSMPDPSLMAPVIFTNGDAAATSPLADITITAGNSSLSAASQSP